MKKKLLIIFAIIVIVGFCSGITYSIFHSSSSLSFTDQDVAKFIFNSQASDNLELNLTDLKPGDIKEYQFAVSNNILSDVSNVTIDYQMTLKTMHFIPIKIELFKEGITDSIMDCNEDDYTRLDENEHELVCNSPIETLGYETSKTDNYTLKVTFPNEYNDESYANLADYIDLEIKSNQKLG